VAQSSNRSGSTSGKRSNSGTRKTPSGTRSRNTASGNTGSRSTTSRSATSRSASSKSATAAGTKTGRQVNIEETKPLRERYIPTEDEKKIHGEIKLLIALTVSVLLLLSNFGIISPVGDYVSYFMFGLFGYVAYVLPILLFIGVAFFLSNRESVKAMIRLGAGITFVVLFSGFLQLIMFDKSRGIGAHYTYCGANKCGGGFFGALVAKGLYSLIGYVGAIIVVVILLISCVVLITERSFINGIKNGSKKVYNTAKEDVAKIKENAVERAEEKEYQANRRIHKKVRGVAISKVGDTSAQNEDVHEITGTVGGNVFRGHVDIEEISRNPKSELDGGMSYNQKPDLDGGMSYNQKQGLYEGISYNSNTEFDDGVSYNPYPEQEEYELNTYEENEEMFMPQDKFYGRGATGLDGKEPVLPKQEQKFSLLDNGNKYVTAIVGTAKGFDDGKSDEGDFDFRPAEKVQVSQSAVNIMKRKPFEMPEAKPVEEITDKPAFTGIPNDENADLGSGQPKPKKPKEYRLPSTNLLNKGNGKKYGGTDLELVETANNLKQILETFGVRVTINNYSKGPSVTRYELQPEVGTRLSKITSLADDIKLNLAATDIRIEAPIPGKSAVGIEVPNTSRETVLIRELIESEELAKNPSKLAFAAGKDIAGKVVVADIAKMPHMLIAGTTGSGKSVFTNSIIMTILYRAKPSDVKLIIIDPKVVEFGVYNGIPHLLQPVVTDAKLASNTLKWAVNEMSERYKKFAEMNVRDLKGYNDKIASNPELEKLPQILIVIDELADLMMVAAKEVEESICRLAQLARAAGIHLIIATQRPSVDVVTGLIKANIPSRTALMVSSGTDSRTIIDSVGAEKLLGNGDMLFYPSGYVKPVRLQGAFVSDAEVQKVVNFWAAQAGEVSYDNKISDYISVIPQGSPGAADADDGRDEYFVDAGRFITDKQKASISSLQRVFKIGFNRAARIIEQLEDAGVVGADEGTKPRNVLMTKEEFENFING